MSDTLGAAAPESSPAPEVAVELPNPISTEAQPELKLEQKADTRTDKVEAKPDKPISAREALERAALKVEKDNKVETRGDPKTEPKATEKPITEKPRDETGKFSPKDPSKIEAKEAKPETKPETKPSYTAGDPPTRFAPDVKAEWAKLPENVRGEVSRMERELTQGYEKHKTAAERDASLNEFHEMAKQSGKDLPSVVREYVNMEQMLRTKPLDGLAQIMSRIGISPRQYAEHILGQTPDQNASQQDTTIRELRQTVQQLEQRVGSVQQTFQKQQESSTLQEVTAFAEKNPRFEELADDIAFFMKSGRGKDLSEAYQLAERLNPAPAKATIDEAAKAPVIDLSAQTERGQKSINGAPSAGSSPAMQPSKSIKDALRKAMAQAG